MFYPFPPPVHAARAERLPSLAPCTAVAIRPQISHRTLHGGQERVIRNSQQDLEELDVTSGGGPKSTEALAKARTIKTTRENADLKKQVP